MPLEFQTAQSAFRLGVEEGVDPHHVPFGTLLTAENVEWQKDGRLQKRDGTAALANTFTDPYTSGTIATGNRLFARGDELCLVDGNYVYSYADSLAAWRRISSVPEVGIRTETMADTLSGTRSCDVIELNGQVVHAWVGGDPYATAVTGAPFLQVTDPTSSTKILQPVSLGNYNGLGIRLVPLGGGVCVLICHQLGVDVYISYQLLNSSFVLVSSGDLVGPINAASSGWDAVAFGSSLLLAVQIPGATPNVKIYEYNSSVVLTATGTSTEASALGVRHMALGTDGNVIWMSHYSNGALKISAFDNTLAQTLVPTVVEAANFAYGMGIITTDSTHCLLVYTVSTTGADLIRTASAVYSTAGAVSAGSQRGTWYTRIACKPFLMGGRYYAVVAESPYTNVFGGGTNVFLGVNTILIEVETTAPGGATTNATTPHRHLGKIDHLVGGVYSELYAPPPNTVTVSATETQVVTMFVTIVAPGSREQSMRLVHATIGTSRPGDMWRCVTHGQEAYLAAGSVTAYDGRSAFDYGFSRPPFLISLTSSGGTFDVGKYLYGWTYEYRSAAGVLHRSPTFVNVAPYQNTGTGVTSVLSGNSISCKQNYRTGFGASSGLTTSLVTFRSIANGDTPQRLTVDPGGTFSSQSATVASVTIVDGGPDTNIDGLNHTLATRPTIYTAGGAYDDEQPPAVLTQFLFKSRIFALADDGMTWWYTKSFLTNAGVAPGFSSLFQIPFDDPQTAGVAMDDKAIFFGPSSIYYMLGDGPASNGSGNDFTTPARIQSDTGCTNARSVVATPDGVMFQSVDGQIRLLTRQLEVVRIGKPVQDFTFNFPNITSAVLVPTKNQVRFTANEYGNAFGVVLVYDYQVKQWSVFRYYDTISAVASCPIADACIWRGRYTFVTTNGCVFYESPLSGSLDGGTTYVSLKVETAWFNAAGPLGFDSVRKFALRGTSVDNHDLSVSVGFDSDEGAWLQGPVTFLAGTPVTSTGPLERCEVTINTRRKCEAIRFKIEDATPTDPGTYPVGGGRGPRLDTMAIEVGVKQGPRPVSATRKG